MVVSDRHVQNSHDLSEMLLVSIWERLHELSFRYQTMIEGASIGLNFGAYALCGASQPHLHYSFAGIGPNNVNASDAITEACRRYAIEYPGRDYQTDYISALCRAKLIVAKNTHGVLYVPIAQRFRHELQIMPRAPGVGNLLDTTPAQRVGLARLEFLAHTIYARMVHVGVPEVEALNSVWYTTRFNVRAMPEQRLVVALTPRTAILAFYELLRNFVVDVLPWDSAAELRRIARTVVLPACTELA